MSGFPTTFEESSEIFRKRSSLVCLYNKQNNKSKCPYKERTICTLMTSNRQMLPGCVLDAPKQSSRL